MKKLVIGAIATATVLLAGIFAFLPVQQANAVHLSIQAATAGPTTLTSLGIDPAAGGTAVTLTCDVAFQLIDVDIVNTTDPAADNTYILTKDQDGAGPTFTQTLPIVGEAPTTSPYSAPGHRKVDFCVASLISHSTASLAPPP